jgi:hypothetical protein
MDRTAAWLLAVVPAAGSPGPARACARFVAGRGSPAALAIGLGHALAYRATQARGGVGIRQAPIAWEQVAPLFQAAARPRWAAHRRSPHARVRRDSSDGSPIVLRRRARLPLPRPRRARPAGVQSRSTPATGSCSKEPPAAVNPPWPPPQRPARA